MLAASTHLFSSRVEAVPVVGLDECATGALDETPLERLVPVSGVALGVELRQRQRLARQRLRGLEALRAR